MTVVAPLVNETQIFALIGPFFSDDYRRFLEPPPRTREDAFIFRWGRNLSTVLCWIQIDFIWSSCWLLFIFILLFRLLLYWSSQRSTEWFHVRWQILFGFKRSRDRADGGTDQCMCSDRWQWWYLFFSPPEFPANLYIDSLLLDSSPDWPIAQPAVRLGYLVNSGLNFRSLVSINLLMLGAYRWLLTPSSWLLVLWNTTRRCCFCILSLTDLRNRLYFAPQSLTDASFVLPVIASNAAVVAAALCWTMKTTSNWSQ